MTPPRTASTTIGSKIVGGWQNDEDIPNRRIMIGKIIQLLQQRKPDASKESLERLPALAKKLELSLYRSAASYDEYADVNTLMKRIQDLVIEIKKSFDHGAAPPPTADKRSAPPESSSPPPPKGPQHQQQQQLSKQPLVPSTTASKSSLPHNRLMNPGKP